MESKYKDRQVFGLDPLIRCCLRLQIKDIVNLQYGTFDQYPDILTLNGNHVVNKVEVCGIVVRVYRKNKRVSYSDQIQNLRLPSSFNSKLQSLHLTKKCQEQGYDIGDLIVARGKLTQYMEQMEMDVQDICKMDNPNFEFERILSLPKLYEYYKKPYVLPKMVLAELKLSHVTESNQSIAAWELQSLMQQHLENYSCDMNLFTATEVLSWPLVLSKLKSLDGPAVRLEPMIADCLVTLSKSCGLVCVHCGNSGSYEPINMKSTIVTAAIQCLQVSCTSGTNMEQGCHIKELKRQLEKEPNYKNIEPAVLHRVVEVAEESGNIVSLGNDRFLPIC